MARKVIGVVLDNAPIVLVLASGRGERFRAAGGTGAKLQADLAGQTVLARTLAAVAGSGLRWHLEDAGHPGMGDSIAAAVRATSAAPGWLVLPGDLPLVLPDTLRRVAHALAAPVQAVQPVYRGERGHPVAFAGACGEALAALTGDRGAHGVLKTLREAGRVAQIEVDDAGIVTDVDTPEALAAAARLLAARASCAS